MARIVEHDVHKLRRQIAYKKQTHGELEKLLKNLPVCTHNDAERARIKQEKLALKDDITHLEATLAQLTASPQTAPAHAA